MNAPQAPQPLTDEELADCGLLSELSDDPIPTLRLEPEAVDSSSGSFTPGPWVADKPKGAPYFGIHREDGTTVAGTSSGLGEADARLIAAAPDLLKACQQALYALKGREHDQFLRDAIALATGA